MNRAEAIIWELAEEISRDKKLRKIEKAFQATDFFFNPGCYITQKQVARAFRV